MLASVDATSSDQTGTHNHHVFGGGQRISHEPCVIQTSQVHYARWHSAEALGQASRVAPGLAEDGSKLYRKVLVIGLALAANHRARTHWQYG